jgi:hypothetical protein
MSLLPLETFVVGNAKQVRVSLFVTDEHGQNVPATGLDPRCRLCATPTATAAIDSSLEYTLVEVGTVPGTYVVNVLGNDLVLLGSLGYVDKVFYLQAFLGTDFVASQQAILRSVRQL